MLRTKKEVDKHVQELLKKVNKDNERKLLGFNIAKLYSQIGEHKVARQHLSSFLSVKESSAQGHRLSGQISEALGEIEAAVRSYKRSFDLDPHQKDLVFKICHLVCELPASSANRDLQQCWLERGEAIQPQHSSVFELKQHLMFSTNETSHGKMEDFLKDEMHKKPFDMKLSIQLLKVYLNSSRIQEAYDHARKTEALQLFRDEPEWYSCTLDVFAAYSKQRTGVRLDPEYYCHLLNAVERYSFLKITIMRASSKVSQSLIDAASNLLRLDETLVKASAAGVDQQILLHFTCELYFQAGLVVLQKAKAGLDEEHEALAYAATLFAVAYNQQVGCKFSDKKIADAWNASATYRKSQCGHCIVAWEARQGRKWVVDVVKRLNNEEGKKKIFDSIFDNMSQPSTSFAQHFDFPDHQLELPAFADLLDIDKVAVKLNQNALHHIIWTGIRYFTMHRRSNETEYAAEFSQILSTCRFIYDIPFSSSSWNSSAPETLSALDVEAFIYATIYCSVSLEEGNESKGIGTFPACLTKSLCSEQQAAWWLATFKLISGSAKEQLGEMRRTLQRGLDVIRLSANNHGIPLELVAKLAQTFMTRAGKSRPFPTVEVPAPISTEVLTVVQTEALELQATRYWKSFLDMASSGNRFTLPSSGRLFEYRCVDTDIDSLVVRGKLFTGYQTWRSGKGEEGQKILQSITDPYASYYQGLIFKEMAEDELRKGSTIYESRSAAHVLLTKSRDCFYVTLDRLRSPGMDRFHPLDQKLAEVIEKIERKLGNAGNISTANGHTTDEDESQEREFVTPQQVTSTPFRRSVLGMTRNGNSRLEVSSRMEARPSPERLDAQLRQMVHKQEEFNQAISDELKQIRAEVVDIKSLIQKLESHLEIQAKQETKQLKKKKSEERFSEIFAECGYGEGEEGWDDDDAQTEGDGEAEGGSEDVELNSMAKLKGKLKIIQPGSSLNMPLYNPPFVPPVNNRFPFNSYGPFPPNPYSQYPGYPGYMGVPPAGAYALPPGYNYPWEMQNPVVPPGPFIPPVISPAPTQQMVQPVAPSVFSRLGGVPSYNNTPIVEAPLQPPPMAQPPIQNLVPHAQPETLEKQAPAHVFQINLPASAASPDKVAEPPRTSAPPKTPLNILASIPDPQYSSVGTADKEVKSSPLKPARDRKVSSCSEKSYDPEEENQVDFQPIIPLPEEVEVTTGEEDEEVMFDQRCKLFRLSDAEWKERGIGQLKLLLNPFTNKVRLLMRREQVFKICANHLITPDLKLSDMKSAKNSWIWAAMDFADGEGRLEKFAARFKTPELATEFQQAFEKAKTIRCKTEVVPVSNDKSKTTVEGFGDKFAPKAGTWNCSDCYVTNPSDSIRCVACETLKPGAVDTASASNTISKLGISTTPSLGFKFGVPSTTGFNIAPPSSTTPIVPSVPAMAEIKFGVPSFAQSGTTSSVAPSPFSSGFGFVTPSSTSSAGADGFKFGVPTSAPSAAAPPASTEFQFKICSPSTAVSTSTSTTVAGSSTFSGFKFTSPVVTSTAAATSGTVTPSPLSSFSFSPLKTALSTPALATPAVAAVTKAPFSFTPPKLAVEPKVAESSILNGSSSFSSASASIFDSLKKTSTSPAITPAPSVFPLFGASISASSLDSTSKTLVGGFAFSSAPLVTPVKEEKAKESVQPVEKPNPFQGLNFSITTPKAVADSNNLFNLFGSGTPGSGFTSKPNAEFPGAGTPLFKKKEEPTQEIEDGEDHADGDQKTEEYEPTVTFEPVIPLPELVQVTTGEEEENVLFSDRAFLYRFVNETKEWKEKGRGDMKILEHKTNGRIRLLMRREQVLKICCNHAVSALLSMKPLQTSDRTWTWSAQDFSEGELVQETFALKFKTEEQAKKFKKAFDEAQVKSSVLPEPKGKPAAAAGTESVVKNLNDLFKPKEGSWECQGCYSRNAAETLKCPSCETVKPGTEPKEPVKASLPVVKSFSELFKPKEGSWECQGCYTRNSGDVTKCLSCEALKPGAQPSTSSTSLTTGAFSFGGTFTTPSESSFPSFGSIGFGFSKPMVPASASPVKYKTERSPNVSVNSENEFYQEEESDNIHFEPVIPLPDKIDVKTGEEDEDVVYCHRAKLMRLAGGEWKERGLGDVKILRHKVTGKTRLLMRREQIHKICLNHALTSDLTFRPKDERSWMWAAQDFTEGQGTSETFVIRFRDAEIAKSFMAAIKNNQGSDSSAEDDLEVVFCKEATADQKKRAADLKLPLNFFLYENAPPCAGCRGCESPASDSTVEKTETKTAVKTESDVPSFNWKVTDPSIAQLSFSSLATATGGGFSKPEAFSWSGTGQPIFGASSAQTKPRGDEENGDDDDGEPENYDPHFEPIIPLPNLVQVKTGEEDEDVVFSHRAKLYRFDSSTKEWKEKGVGDIKILNNKEKNTYRVLLRRDQIHKLACNHWITPDMVLKPLSTSTTAWTWFAMDFSQGELVSEQFAARFKTDEPAALFHSKFVECQNALQINTAAENTVEPTSASASEVEPVPSVIQPVFSFSIPKAEPVSPSMNNSGVENNASDTEDDEDDDDDQDEAEYEDVEESIMFEKRCTLSSLEDGSGGVEKTWILLGTGNLKIIYDDEMLCARIVVEEDGSFNYLCDNVIAIETELKVDGKECVWAAIDYSVEESRSRTFRAQFASEHAALEFKDIFAEGKQFAEKAEVHDEPDLYASGYDHSNEESNDYEGGKF